MSDRDPIEHRRRAFLHRCLRAGKPPLDLLADVGVSQERFAEWTRDPAFRRRLDHVVRHLRRVRELHLQIAAANAVRTLESLAADKVAGDAKPMVRAACVDLIRLAGNRSREPAGDASDDESATTEPIRFHPDLAPEDAETLARELSRDASAPTIAQG